MRYHFGYPFNPARADLPTAPQNLRVTASDDTNITLEWDASTQGDFPISNYKLIADDLVIATPVGTSFIWDSVPANESVNYRVQAIDSDGNAGIWSDTLTYTNEVITTLIQLTYDELFRDAPTYFPNVIEAMGGLYNGQAYGANHIVPDGSGVDYAIGAGSTPPVYNEDVDNFTILINTENTGTVTADGADFGCTVAGSVDRPQLQVNMIADITDVLYNVRYIVTIHTGTAYVSHTQDGDVPGGSNITDINETLPVGTHTYEEQGYARTGDWFRIHFDSSVEFTWTGSVVVEIERV